MVRLIGSVMRFMNAKKSDPQDPSQHGMVAMVALHAHQPVLVLQHCQISFFFEFTIVIDLYLIVWPQLDA